jgi:hypothetical protein
MKEKKMYKNMYISKYGKKIYDMKNVLDRKKDR